MVGRGLHEKSYGWNTHVWGNIASSQNSLSFSLERRCWEFPKIRYPMYKYLLIIPIIDKTVSWNSVYKVSVLFHKLLTPLNIPTKEFKIYFRRHPIRFLSGKGVQSALIRLQLCLCVVNKELNHCILV